MPDVSLHFPQDMYSKSEVSVVGVRIPVLIYSSKYAIPHKDKRQHFTCTGTCEMF